MRLKHWMLTPLTTLAITMTPPCFAGMVTQDGYTYTIQDEIEQKYPELTELILNTQSMDSNEKQYWFDLLPLMTDEQIDGLEEILQKEKRELDALNTKSEK